MVDFRIDRFKYNWRGEWTTATNFIRDDVVNYNGSSYVCIKAHTASLLFNNDLTNQDTVNTVPDPYWVKMTDGRAWKNQWTVSSVYDAGDIVAHGGNLYLCIDFHQSSATFFDDNSKWAVFSTGILFRPVWETEQLYRVNEIVRYNGIVFKCIVDHISNTSLTNDQNKWTIFYEGDQYRNRWNLENNYRSNDVVTYKGSLYKAIKESSGVDFNTSNWSLIAPGYRFKNAWNDSSIYGIGEVVRHGGWLFYSTTDNVNKNPANDIVSTPENWQIILKGIAFKGEWNLDEVYKPGDVVRRGGQLFVSIAATTLSSSGLLDYLDETKWELLNKGKVYQSSWKTEENYFVGDIVIFFGTAFTCKLAHLSDNTNFPSLDIAAAGTGLTFWDILVPSGSDAGLQYRGDLLSYNLVRDFYNDESSFGKTRVQIGSVGELLTINNTNDVTYKNYGEVNRVIYVAESGVDDDIDPRAGFSPFKPYRTVRFACQRADDNFDGTTTVRVRTGLFKEILPISVPARTAIVGDELRSTTISAAEANKTLENDSDFTISALTRLSQIVQEIISAEPSGLVKSANNPLVPIIVTKKIQVSFDPPVIDDNENEIFNTIDTIVVGSQQAAFQIQNLILDINQYIQFYLKQTGSNPALTSTNIPTQSEEYQNTVLILKANRNFLAEEAIAFTKLNSTDYIFDEEIYRSNFKQFIDAWIYDISFTGNYKSLLAARYYRNIIKGSTLEDMFYLRNATGVRNLTVAGINGELIIDQNKPYSIPTGGAYCSLDPGWGVNDDRTWIKTRSPYIQNVTTLGHGAVGQKIDGALHAGGNRSITSNDFTQVIDDGIGAWVLNQGRAELVSVFSYYAHVGYLATNGGIIRGTNGNNSYGTFGAIADGNDTTEIPQQALLNTRNQEALATIFAGDFTDEIQILEWDNAGQEYTQATAQFVGAGIDAAVIFEDFRDNAVFSVERLDTSDTIIQSIGGGGYIRVQNNAQVHETQGGDLTSITIAANDSNSEAVYLGCRIILTAGSGTGQYGYITGYDTTTKVVSVARESDNQPGWDHLVQGTLPAVPLTSSTSYRIEPRPIFVEPPYEPRQFALGLNTNWGSIAYSETTEIYSNIPNNEDVAIATFNITKNGRIYQVDINTAGAGYNIGDEFFISGEVLGGSTPHNDLTITVTAVTEDTVKSILAISSSGVGASGKFVAITEGGTAGLYSENGESWPDGFSMPTAGNWTVLGAGNNRFVAFKPNSQDAAISLSGKSWSAINLDQQGIPGRNWSSIAFGNNRFVVTATDTAEILSSTNNSGLSWRSNAALPILDYSVKSIAQDSEYVYVSSQLDNNSVPGFLVYRKSNWSLVSEAPADFGQPNDIAVDETYVYLAVNGALAVILKSDWSLTNVTETGVLHAVAADSEYVYIGGQTIDGDQYGFGVIRRSDWSLVSGVPSFNNQVYAIAEDTDYVYVGGTFTGTDQNRFAVIRKSDWSLVSGVPSFDIGDSLIDAIAEDTDYVYVGGNFPGEFAVIRKSDWSLVSGVHIFNPGGVQAIAEDTDYVYVGGNFPGKFAVIRKSDWSLVSQATWDTNAVNAIAVDEDYVYIGSQAGLGESTLSVVNTLDFSLVTAGDSGISDSTSIGWKDITFGKNLFVVISSDKNEIAYSSSGITWQGVLISEAPIKEWVSIAYGNNRFVAISATGDVTYSFTAADASWIPATLPIPAGSVKWRKIRYAQGVFFALAESLNNSSTSFAASSADGIVWTVRILASSAFWKDISFGNPYVEQFDSTVGKNTPMWVAITNSNVTNNIKVGTRALGRVEVNAGVISNVRIWDPGTGYQSKPGLSVISPTATSDAKFQCRLADGVLANPSWLNRGFGYRTRTTTVTVTGNGFADVIPIGKFITLENFNRLPGPGAQLFFNNNPIRYTVATINPLNAMKNGNFGALIRVSPELQIRDDLQHNVGVTIREKYSQVRISGHDFLDIGTGNFRQTNYPELYDGVFFTAPENEVREVGGGRVFYTSTDQSGNFRTGELFSVEQATGIVTISADFFDLSGLEELRLGGIRVGGTGAVIKEFSTDPTLSEDSNNIVPTQRAIAAFLSSRLSLGGSEVATFQIQSGQVFLGGPDRISNPIGLKIVFPGIVEFSGEGAGISGSILAQNMFYRSFGE